MKVWADFSALAKMAALCVLLGFVLGLFVACSALPQSSKPATPAPNAAVPAARS
jgi:hypothetical protein